MTARIIVVQKDGSSAYLKHGQVPREFESDAAARAEAARLNRIAQKKQVTWSYHASADLKEQP